MQTLKTVLYSSLLFFPTAIALAGEPSAKPPVQNSLCRAEEQIIFSCAVARAKILSLCGATTLDHRRGYLQYRFGKPGALELQFPRERANTQLAFRYAHYFRAQVDRTEVTFDNEDYRYVLFDYYEGDTKPAIKESGVRIQPRVVSGGKETEIECRGRAIGSLARLAAVVPRDNDNPLNQ